VRRMRRFAVGAVERAQRAAFGPAEHVEQQSFVRATELRALAERAGIGPGVSVLDLCCGIGGPGRFLTRELGCQYLGVDLSEEAIAVARERAGELPCRFVVQEIPPLPPGTFDVVLLLETLLAFRDKETLLRELARALPAGGRFACTLEEGAALTASERAQMPAADTVWLTPRVEMHKLLARAGLAVRWEADWSESHRAVAESLAAAYAADATTIAAQIGDRALDELLMAHRQWNEWFATGRVRKLALVAER
jgi:ubiquinone/menaquinone biosynthesis C-methylase UbiE